MESYVVRIWLPDRPGARDPPNLLPGLARVVSLG
jgi:hypothetical protein